MATRSACSTSTSTAPIGARLEAKVNRRIELEGPANFRDVGGYENRDGRVVRAGRVYRSDSLSHMTDSDVRHCVDELGIHTVIDLRARHEVDQFSHGPLEATGVRFLHRPVVDETRRDSIIRDPGAPAPELLSPAAIYLMMLERFADRLTDVVRLIADPANHPVVFHCAAGKDRTGIVAALVLGVLGVDDETIVDDYVLTADHMPLMVQRHRAVAAERGVEAEVGEPHFAAEAEAMRDVLIGLETRHGIDGRGGVEGYLLHNGLAPDAIATLRSALLT
ncbi:MAG: tyrosine-protein phosphatase [Acidimicrobiia bacterium]